MSEQTTPVRPDGASAGQPSIEQCLDGLRSIAERMQAKDISMDDAMRLYRDGLQLANEADRILNHYEAEIQVIEDNANECG